MADIWMDEAPSDVLKVPLNAPDWRTEVMLVELRVVFVMLRGGGEGPGEEMLPEKLPEKRELDGGDRGGRGGDRGKGGDRAGGGGGGD